MSVSAATHAGPRGFPWKTRLPTAFNAVGGAEPDAVFARLHCWSRVTEAHSAVAGAAHAAYDSLRCQLDMTARFRPLRRLHGSLDRLRRKLHYLNGRLADGTGEDPLGQRVYKRTKRIRQEILDHCSTISIFPV